MKRAKQIPQEKWRWFGMPGHLIVSDRCVHHLCTQVGKYLISTVGEYRPNRDGQRDTIGSERFFETMVFKSSKKLCACGCGIPEINPSEIDFLPANDAPTADANHLKLCRKYAAHMGRTS